MIRFIVPDSHGGDMKIDIQTKRIYDAAEPEDGYRVLVDRLWPRGVAKALAAVDLWLKEIAPSTALRQWFNHDPAKWTTFKISYFRELHGKPDLVTTLLEKAATGRLTLLFSARDLKHNQAIALKEYLIGHDGV